eukprot:6340716-Amphidinium_carterae.1
MPFPCSWPSHRLITRMQSNSCNCKYEWVHDCPISIRQLLCQPSLRHPHVSCLVFLLIEGTHMTSKRRTVRNCVVSQLQDDPPHASTRHNKSSKRQHSKGSSRSEHISSAFSWMTVLTSDAP